MFTAMNVSGNIWTYPLVVFVCLWFLQKDRSIESLQDKWQGEGSKSSFQGSTALLFELEDKIAQAASDVQNAQTQVSYIENRIAALNSGGMPMEQRRKEMFMKQDSQGED